MKNLSPLLFLVACADVDSLERNIASCRSDLDRTQTSLLWCKEDKIYMDNLLDACQANLNMRAEAKPVLLSLPIRPNLDLEKCIYVLDKTWCMDTSEVKNWSDFGCIANDQTKVVYCDVSKCRMFTSDGKSCAL